MAKREQLIKEVVYHVATSEDGKTWNTIQGNMEPFRTEPGFFADPEHAEKVCLFFRGMDIMGARWSVAQATAGDYATWKMFHAGSWKHDVPGR